jgi:hypothetical protein
MCTIRLSKGPIKDCRSVIAIGITLGIVLLHRAEGLTFASRSETERPLSMT